MDLNIKQSCWSTSVFNSYSYLFFNIISSLFVLDFSPLQDIYFFIRYFSLVFQFDYLLCTECQQLLLIYLIILTYRTSFIMQSSALKTKSVLLITMMTSGKLFTAEQSTMQEPWNKLMKHIGPNSYWFTNRIHYTITYIVKIQYKTQRQILKSNMQNTNL